MQSGTRTQLRHGSDKKSNYRTGYNPRGLLGPVTNRQKLSPIARVIVTLWIIGIVFVLSVGSAVLLSEKAEASQIPSNAYKFRSFLIREARFEYGMEAPVPLFAGQIHQESAWRPDVSSPYADGLTQFTPDTAKWIAELYPDLGTADAFNPKWAIRAMLRYNKHLYSLFKDVTSECDRWAFVLSSYNGGYGWIKRDRRIAISNGKDPTKWWDNVELYSSRAEWAFEENRDYPRKIIYIRQELYLQDSRWPGTKICRQEDTVVVDESIATPELLIEASILRDDQVPMMGAKKPSPEMENIVGLVVISFDRFTRNRHE